MAVAEILIRTRYFEHANRQVVRAGNTGFESGAMDGGTGQACSR